MMDNGTFTGKCILVTGFDAFGGHAVNPAWEAVKCLPDEIKGYRLVKLNIPTVFKKAADVTAAAVSECGPDYIFMIGQAGGSRNVRAEKVAINYQNAGIGDNEGNKPCNMKIAEDGPDAYFTNVDAFEITRRMKEENFRIEMSYSAGTFVCNDTFYRVANAVQGSRIKYEFLHLPYLPVQTVEGEPCMTLEEMTGTIAKFIELAADTEI